MKSKKKQTPKPDPFTESERNAFDGLHLHPWTHSRRVAAQTLGMQYPNLSKADWAAVNRGGAYPGAARDIMLALWLCTIPDEEIIKTEIAGIENAMKESMEFGIKLGIHEPMRQGFWLAMRKCMDMWHAVSDAITIPDPELKMKADNDDEGND